MDGIITLIVKAANQSVPDHRLECDAEWTILKVKGLLSSAHPSKPKVEEQRLIYSGQLLLDDLQLRNVLRHPTENNAYTIHLVCSPPRHASPSSSSSQSSSATTPRPSQSQTQQPQQPSPALQTSAVASGGMTAPQQQEAPATAPAASSEGESSDGLRRRNVTVTSSDGTSVATPQGIEAAAGYPTQAQVTMSVLQATADPIQQMATMQQMYANYMAYMQYIQMGGGMPWPQQMLHHIPTLPSNAATNAGQGAASPSADSVEQQAHHQPQVAGDQNMAANQQPQQPQPQPQIRMNAQGGEVEDDDENEGLGRDWLDWIYVLSRMVVLLSVVYFYSTISRFMIVVCIALLLYLYQAGWFRPTRRAVVGPEQQQQQQQQVAGGGGGGGAAAEGNENEPDEEGPDDRNNNVSNNNNNNEVPDQLVMENQEQQQQQQQQQPQPPLAQENNNDVTDRAAIEADDLHVRPSLLALSWTFLTTFFTSLIPEQPQVM